MTRRQRLLAVTTALSIAAGGVGIFVTQDDSPAGGQRAAKLLATKGCDVTITSPAPEPGGVTKLSAGQSLAVTVTGRALRCPGVTVTVNAIVNGGEETTLGTAVVSAAGAWTYGPTTLADQSTTVLVAKTTTMAEDAARPAEARLTIDANTARPRVVLTTPAPNGSNRAYVVAPAADGGCGSGGNARAEHREPGYIHDLGCAAGGQVSPALTVYGGCQGHGDAGVDSGCDPGSLAVTYGVTPLASVAITQSPQTFTAVELGAWDLDDWTRDDLLVRAAAGGDAGVAEVVVDLQVSTGVPPALEVTMTVLDNRHADVDVSWVLPVTPAPVARPTIELYHSNHTRRAYNASGGLVIPNVSRGVFTVTTTPTAIAAPETAGRGGVNVTTISDAGQPVFCGLDPGIVPDAGVRIQQGAGAEIANYDAGGYSAAANGCLGMATPPTVYCVTAAGTSKVTATETGFCPDFSRDWMSNPTNATHIVACWGDGTEVTDDAGTEVQLWRCHDGEQYRGGTTYVEHLTWLPSFNTYYFSAAVIW